MAIHLSPRSFFYSLCWLMALAAQVPSNAAASQPAPAPAAAPVTPAAGATYKPKPGETLDQVINKTMVGSPLSMGILRKAFIDQNPQGIIAGKVPKLRKGATLNVPDHDMLLRGVLASVTPVPVSNEVAPRPANASPEERKRWVKYP